MSCIALPKSTEQTAGPTDTSWEAIAELVRAHATAQQPGLARELLEWADFVDGIAQLHARSRNR